MPAENGDGRTSSNGVAGSFKYAVALFLAGMTISAGIAGGVGTYAGWQGAREAMAPVVDRIENRVQSAETRFDARVEAVVGRFTELVNAARAEDAKRREEIRGEAIEQRREVEARLRDEIAREREDARDHISGLQERLERLEALIYGRSGGAR